MDAAAAIFINVDDIGFPSCPAVCACARSGFRPCPTIRNGAILIERARARQ